MLLKSLSKSSLLLSFSLAVILLLQSSSLVVVVVAAETPAKQQQQQQQADNDTTATATAAADTPKKQPRIVGGQLADPNEYAAFVHGTNGELCGGSLIHPDVALSAAHCAAAFGGDYLILGSNNVYGLDGAPLIPIASVYPHPAYTPGTEENDIMLIKLGQPVLSVPVIPLNDDPSLPVEGQILRVMGFGRVVENGDISEELLEVDLEFVSMPTCQQQLPELVFEQSHICAGGSELGGKDSCEGDSGSPLLDAETGVQFGLVTFGVGCARANTPGVYTNVQYYLDWIQEFICEHSSIKPDYCGVAVVKKEEEEPENEDDEGDDSSTGTSEEPSTEESSEKPPPVSGPTDGETTTSTTEEPDNGFVSIDLDEFRSSASFIGFHRQLLLYVGTTNALLWLLCLL